MAFARAKAFRALQSSLRHSGRRVGSRVSAPARTQLVQRRFASGGGAHASDGGSDFIWAAGAIAVTVPSCWYLWPEEHHADAGHGGHGEETEHEEQEAGGEDEEQSKGESEEGKEDEKSDEGEEKEDAKATKADDADGDDSQKSEGDKKKESKSEGAKKGESKSKSDDSGSKDEGKDDSKDESKDDGKDDSDSEDDSKDDSDDKSEEKSESKGKDDSKGESKKKDGSNKGKDGSDAGQDTKSDQPKNPRGEEGEKSVSGSQKEKQLGLNQDTRHPNKEDSGKSREADGSIETAKTPGTVNPDGPLKGKS